MTHEEAKTICASAFAEIRAQGTRDVERAVVLRASSDSELMQALCIVATKTISTEPTKRK